MAIVTVTFSTFRETYFNWVISLLNSLEKQTFKDFNVLIVVCSNEKYFSLLKKAITIKKFVDVSFRIDLIFDPIDRGIAHSRNIGLQSSRTPYVIFTDDDAIPDDHWLENLLKTFSVDEKVAATVGPVLPFWSPDCHKDSLDFPDELLWIIGCTTSKDFNSIKQVRNGIASNFALKREVAVKMGGFNEKFGYNPITPLVGEEPEFGVRLIKSGKVTLWNPNAIVYHRITPSRLKIQKILKRSFAEGKTKGYLSKVMTTDLKNAELNHFQLVIKAIFKNRSWASKALLIASTAAVLVGYLESYSKSLYKEENKTVG
jgi:glucosyl-dolichyl phosphate glucuronosyltransferase